MKKLLTLTLAAALALSLAACGGSSSAGTAPVGSAAASQPASAAQSTADTPASAPETAAPAFWVVDGKELIIPETPYTVKRTEITDSGYDIRLDVVDDLPAHEDVVAYCDSLIALGFDQNVKATVFEDTNNPDRKGYDFSASNADGASVWLLDDGNGAMLMVTLP